MFTTSEAYEAFPALVPLKRAGAPRWRQARCSLADIEREYILLALELTEGKKKEAADLLGIDRKTLYRKLEEYGKAE